MGTRFSYFPNGNVNVITNNRDTGRTETFGYDSLNRIISASSQANSGADCWGQAVPTNGGYDRYGNLLNINVTKCSATSLSVSVSASTNQIIGPGGYSYDAAGCGRAAGDSGRRDVHLRRRRAAGEELERQRHALLVRGGRERAGGDRHERRYHQ